METVEVGNIHAVFAHVAGKMVGWQNRLGEYPTNLRETNALLPVASQ